MASKFPALTEDILESDVLLGFVRYILLTYMHLRFSNINLAMSRISLTTFRPLFTFQFSPGGQSRSSAKLLGGRALSKTLSPKILSKKWFWLIKQLLLLYENLWFQNLWFSENHRPKGSSLTTSRMGQFWAKGGNMQGGMYSMFLQRWKRHQNTMGTLRKHFQ